MCSGFGKRTAGRLSDGKRVLISQDYNELGRMDSAVLPPAAGAALPIVLPPGLRRRLDR